MNKTEHSPLNSLLMLGFGFSVTLTGSFWLQERAEATVSDSLAPPVVLQNLNIQTKQSENSVFIPVSADTTNPVNNLPVQTKVGLKLEPIITNENQPNLETPVVLAPVDRLVYQVQPGDTLDKIASKYDSSRQELVQENQISNPNLIKVAQNLTIPTEQLATKETSNQVKSVNSPIDQKIQEQSSLYVEKLKADVNKLRQEYQPNAVEIAQNTSIPVAQYDDEEIITASRNRSHSTLQVKVEDRRTPATNLTEDKTQPSQGTMIATTPTAAEQYNPFLQTSIGEIVSPNLPPLANPDRYLPNTPTFNGFIWPAKGVFTSGYGWRWGRMHKGIDIAAPIGTPIVASAEGEVVTAGWNSGGYGNLVKLKHADGSLTVYAHNKRLLVRRGQKVEQGQRIAEMGSTGRSTGPHLHFEIHPNGRSAVNPVAFLPKKRP
jgi:murein DD-endopeptidase MepM/ murein hydrolase activator NlpD